MTARPGPEPDFAAHEHGPLSPLMGFALWFSASVTAAVVEGNPRRANVGLPPLAQSWIDDQDWALRLASCYSQVRDRLALAVFPVARCTGDELALHLVLAVARASVADGITPPPEVPLAGTLTDDDFYLARRALLPDDDLLTLFDPALDGIDNPGDPLNRRLGIGNKLHPSCWFDTFPGYAHAGPLEPIAMVAIEVDEGAIHAAADLAARSGSRDFVVFHVDDDALDWRAKASYPRGVELVGYGPTPHDAADDLVRAMVEGVPCGCGGFIAVGPYPAGEGECRWRRDAGRWHRGCEDNE